MKIANFSIVICTLMIWGCKTVEDYPPIEKPTIELTHTPFNIDTAYVAGDSLHAIVSYSGGCGIHEFTLESNGPLLKSLPPKQPLRISHRSDGDPCRAIIKEDYKFDIKGYRGTSNGTTFLMLENWNTHLSYSY